MQRIDTHIEIQAPPVRIWSILMDFPSYGEWNPFVRRISGEAVPGRRLTVSIEPPDGRAMTFRPRVLECVENRVLRWRGSFLVPGLLDGEHCLRVEALDPGRSRFVHAETFSGILAGLLRGKRESGIRAGFVAMNQALKSRAEHV